MIRLLIADDHAIVREGLKQLVALTQDIEVAGEAGNGSEVLQQVRNGIFDLLLLDMNMPETGGIELIGLVKACQPALPILIYSMYNEAHMATSAFKAGASGYFSKSSDPAMLVAAIRKVSGGGQYIDPMIAEQMAFDSAFPQRKLPHTLLSDREFQIFRLLVAGKSVNEIARQLCICNKTVSTHKTNLMEKMNLRNVADLVRYAMQHRLAD
ncbi:MAG: DNA-binding response regulator [Gallionellales bacterium RIFCSPLOWO2_12_FULL_59_22]|nr:MAG: DNA-binding response regulator [Gallionellales bacterium RIFCSPLOWO2_12_FULL_59_22]